MRPPAHNRHDRAQYEAGIQPEISTNEETRGSDSAPDDGSRVEDSGGAAGPLAGGVEKGAIEIGPLFVDDRDEGEVWIRSGRP